jgi:DNA-binding MarR family transcriptional regulator/GNAT superfamily N-acetyltransferase
MHMTLGGRNTVAVELDHDVDTLRAFNRTYTRRLGLLDAHLDNSPFTLSEARILYELAHREDARGAEIARLLGLDPAQISRTLKRFSDRGLVEARDNPADGRHQLQSLTDDGRAAYAALNEDTQAAIGRLLAGLPPFRRAQLIAAAATITRIFQDDAPPKPILRSLRAGDLGMVTARQAILYAREYGWDMDYEALVARILADFRKTFDPDREAGWIAEMDGRMVGSVFLMAGDKSDVGKLRLLYVEPDARGAGVGSMLVTTCIERARQVGFRHLELWTNSVLTAARSIYEGAGFQLIDETPHRSFGQDLVGQIWSLAL